MILSSEYVLFGTFEARRMLYDQDCYIAKVVFNRNPSSSSSSSDTGPVLLCKVAHQANRIAKARVDTGSMIAGAEPVANSAPCLHGSQPQCLHAKLLRPAPRANHLLHTKTRTIRTMSRRAVHKNTCVASKSLHRLSGLPVAVQARHNLLCGDRRQ